MSVLNDDVQMSQWTDEQPGIQKFDMSTVTIKIWISPLNKPSDL